LKVSFTYTNIDIAHQLRYIYTKTLNIHSLNKLSDLNTSFRISGFIAVAYRK